MTFWAYMLHCRGGAFYVGHTDDLERRIGDHQSGLIPGFTADHQPVEHVWSQEFTTRDEAKAAEKQIKGWSRAKKLALIRGDWERISNLAKGKSGPSTSSGETGLGERNVGSSSNSVFPELVEGLSFALLPHPDAPPSHVRAVSVEIHRKDPNHILLTFKVDGSEALVLPERSRPVRQDGLWQTTCFEMFAKSAHSSGYLEFNLSPSTEWAVHSFVSYREGMAAVEVAVPPRIEIEVRTSNFELEADIDLTEIPMGELAIALCAVIEEADGTKSYWALAHPPGKPDFHHLACFALTLAAPGNL